MKCSVGLIIAPLAAIVYAAPLGGQEGSSSSRDTGLVSMGSESPVTADNAGAVTSTVQITETTSLSSVRPSTVYAFSGASGATSNILELPTGSSELAPSSSDSMDDSSALSQFLDGGGISTSDSSSGSWRISSGIGSSTRVSLTTHHLASNMSSTVTSSIPSSSSSDNPSTSAGANKLALPLIAGGMVAGLAALL